MKSITIMSVLAITLSCGVCFGQAARQDVPLFEQPASVWRQATKWNKTTSCSMILMVVACGGTLNRDIENKALDTKTDGLKELAEEMVAGMESMPENDPKQLTQELVAEWALQRGWLSAKTVSNNKQAKAEKKASGITLANFRRLRNGISLAKAIVIHESKTLPLLAI